MSKLLITRYLNELDKLKVVSGTGRESVVREAFKDLLKGWAKRHDLTFIPEHEFSTRTKERRYVDGALLHTLRVPFGYWEAKDSDDDLDSEIQKKFKAGYPNTNIIFEDSTKAVLIQNGEEILRCPVDEIEQLEKLLNLFFDYERPEIEAFRKAVEQFKVDLPDVLSALRAMIEAAYAENGEFRSAASGFLDHAKEAINPTLSEADVREMLIQHVLTGEVFSAIFPGTPYHEDNNVARKLHELEATFFTGNTKYQTLQGLGPYYAAIRRAASEIAGHHEKQTFLKAIYENFYKVYNPKAADRLGVVYTPNEIVRFMIEGADWLCDRHFGRRLIDKDVQILDPASGTGTFICELIEHSRGQPEKLRRKYEQELHANEVAILPYYVANLNIEATYAAIANEYVEFPNLCFVDTLDNTYALRKYEGHMDDLFGSLSDDNVQRIRRQNSRRISVVIGNPPYNANQKNENENNKNREYPEIDNRLRETYISSSTAQKTKLYDMYARFFRWASDRVDENGIVAFITNRSFIDSRTFDGFRAEVAKEFNEIWLVDLGGDVRANPKLSGPKHNVFAIQTGVAISFMVKRRREKGCRIWYSRRPEEETADEKLRFLASVRLEALDVEEVRPDAAHNWINQSESGFESLVPIASKSAKQSTKPVQQKAIFKLYSFGVVTNRDPWVYGTSPQEVEQKVRFLIGAYNSEVDRLAGSVTHEDVGDEVDGSIKWTRAVKKDLLAGRKYRFEADRIIQASYRPFVKRFLYFSPQLNEMPNLMPRFYGDSGDRKVPSIVFTDPTSQKPFMAIATKICPDMHVVGAAAGAVTLAFESLGEAGRVDNITDWAVRQFRRHYQPGRGRKKRPITKLAIFHYVYAILHDPIYREEYALDLKREFPRIPFYEDFWQWAEWGRRLMGLHAEYEGAEPYSLERIDVADERARAAKLPPKPKLKANKEAGLIVLDSETSLRGVPSEAWEYQLGGRSALEWILDQYKEKKPRDPTVRERFDSYRFAGHKELVIDLLTRVTTVSIETMKIVESMRLASR